MRQFVYFENQEGGMETHTEIHDSQDMEFLRGWGDIDCEREDLALCGWMHRAEVGEMHEHRLGVCVRLRDTST